jgi:hypothetical protein
MNIVPEQNAIRSDDRMSYSNSERYAKPRYRSGRTATSGDQVVDAQDQQMRKVGLVMCLASAILTLASAALIAIGL